MEPQQLVTVGATNFGRIQNMQLYKTYWQEWLTKVRLYSAVTPSARVSIHTDEPNVQICLKMRKLPI